MRKIWQVKNKMKKVKKVCIIGVGMIGGSIGLALKKRRLAEKIIGIGRNPKKLENAKRLKAIDGWDVDLKRGLKDADMVFIAVPVGLIADVAKKASFFLKKNAIITDAGSVKGFLTRKIEKNMKKGIHFIGVHPIAGSENNGVENASPDLFKNAVCVITPTEKTNKQAFNTIKKIWQGVGSKVFVSSPEKHDKVLAFSSHLPHLAAVSLVNTFNVLNKKQHIAEDFVGPGFLDTTRVASGSPEIWKDICSGNSAAILKALESFRKNIVKLENDIKGKKWNLIFKSLGEAKNTRDRIKKTKRVK